MRLGRNEPCHCGSGKKYKHCIEKAFGPDMDHLLRMQLAYDVAKMQ